MITHKSRNFVTVFLCFLFLLMHHGSAIQASVQIKNNELLLSWERTSPQIQEWELRTKEDSEWISLVTRDRTGKKLSEHLNIKGIEASNNGWVATITQNYAEFQSDPNDESIKIRKRISHSKIKYRLSLQIEIKNLTKILIKIPKTFRLVLGPGLGEYPSSTFGIAETLYSFVEPIVFIDGDVTSPELENGSISNIVVGNQKAPFWCGLHSRYYALILKPASAGQIRSISFQTGSDKETDYPPSRYLPEMSINFKADALKAGQSIKYDFLVFSGPKYEQALSGDKSDFSKLLFFDQWFWMRGLSLAILWLMKIIHQFIPSWGATIFVLAVFIRLLLYPIAQRAFSSQKRFTEVQKILQPKIREIKAEFRGEQQSEKILELYKIHSVSPLAGLKPLLIVLVQIPIFIALFHVLGTAFELRKASFLGIETLAKPDHLVSLGSSLPFIGSYFNILPALLAISTLLTIKLSPAPTVDEGVFSLQNIFLVAMALGFFLVFYSFPSGMVIYWTTANILHIFQYKFVKTKNSNN